MKLKTKTPQQLLKEIKDAEMLMEKKKNKVVDISISKKDIEKSKPSKKKEVEVNNPEIQKEIETIKKAVVVETLNDMPNTNPAKSKMPNRIDEYFAKIEGTKQAFHSRQLFTANKEDVDIKTDLSWKEIVLINKLMFDNKLLTSMGLVPIFEDFVDEYLRLKISLDRKSRGEFVSVNRTDNMDTSTQLLSNLSNITGSKK